MSRPCCSITPTALYPPRAQPLGEVPRRKKPSGFPDDVFRVRDVWDADPGGPGIDIRLQSLPGFLNGRCRNHGDTVEKTVADQSPGGVKSRRLPGRPHGIDLVGETHAAQQL